MQGLGPGGGPLWVVPKRARGGDRILVRGGGAEGGGEAGRWRGGGKRGQGLGRGGGRARSIFCVLGCICVVSKLQKREKHWFFCGGGGGGRGAGGWAWVRGGGLGGRVRGKGRAGSWSGGGARWVVQRRGGAGSWFEGGPRGRPGGLFQRGGGRVF